MIWNNKTGRIYSLHSQAIAATVCHLTVPDFQVEEEKVFAKLPTWRSARTVAGTFDGSECWLSIAMIAFGYTDHRNNQKRIDGYVHKDTLFNVQEFSCYVLVKSWIHSCISYKHQPSLEHQKELKVAFTNVFTEVPGSPIFLMKMVSKARHLEIQIVGDEYGNTLALNGRDCSTQRTWQIGSEWKWGNAWIWELWKDETFWVLELEWLGLIGHNDHWDLDGGSWEGQWIQRLWIPETTSRLRVESIIFSPGDFRRSSRKVHQPLPKKRFSMRWNVQLCALLPWWVTEAGTLDGDNGGNMWFDDQHISTSINSFLASLKCLVTRFWSILYMFKLSG